jgi:hypothetical protein
MTGWYDVRQRRPAEPVPGQADPNAASLGSRSLGAKALDSISAGWEISNATDGSGGPNGYFTCSSYRLTFTFS